MTTITLNCEAIDWIDKSNRSIEVWYRNSKGEKAYQTLDPIICETHLAEDNLYYLVQAIEDDIDELLCEADRLYLEKALLPTIEKWSLIEED